MKKRTAHFGPELFRFLRDLAKNNNRPWFEANKPRYEEHVKDPLLRFIADFGPELAKISRRYLADPRPVGGSMFRIYRDTRFSNDKSPYKVQASAHFRHQDCRDVHSPGFYLHLEPGSVFLAAGIWHPDAEALHKIRSAVVEKPAAFKRAIKGCALAGAALKRPPRGFDPEHKLIEHLRRKDFVTTTQIDEKEVLTPGFLSVFSKNCGAAAPLMKFLTQSVGLPF